jgi:hypothetical protein
MHIFYLQLVKSKVFYPTFKVVAISTPRLPECPQLGDVFGPVQAMSLVVNGFQVVLQPREFNESDYFDGCKRKIHIASGYHVKRDTIPHQILPQPEPVQKTDKQPDKVETLRRPWWHFGIW